VLRRETSADDYFLDTIWETPRLRPLVRPRRRPRWFRASTPVGSVQFLPDGFGAMVVPDWRLLERARYEFKFVRREFLGDARCFVLEVKPSRAGRDGFSGRIWVDDRDYTIVRFNGINRSVDQTLVDVFPPHAVVSRRRVADQRHAGVWLPSYVYCEETDLKRRAVHGRQGPVQGVRCESGLRGAGGRGHARIDDDSRRLAVGPRWDGALRPAVADSQPAAVGAGGRGERRSSGSRKLACLRREAGSIPCSIR